jgi:hypothetical protein
VNCLFCIFFGLGALALSKANAGANPNPIVPIVINTLRLQVAIK